MSSDEIDRPGNPGTGDGMRPRPALRRIASIAETALALPAGDPRLAAYFHEVRELAQRALAVAAERGRVSRGE